VKSNLAVILAERQKRTGKRESIRSIAKATRLNEYTVRGFANNTLTEYPKHALTELCRYFNCSPGDILILEETAE